MGFPIRVGAKAVILQGTRLLLVEYNDQHGLHYNLPGGGIEAGESIKAGLQREVLEETCAAISVGPLLQVIEYEPQQNAHWAGSTHKLTLIFRASLAPHAQPALPATPDPSQTAVRWVELAELQTLELLPHLDADWFIEACQRPDDWFAEEPLNLARTLRYRETH